MPGEYVSLGQWLRVLCLLQLAADQFDVLAQVNGFENEPKGVPFSRGQCVRLLTDRTAFQSSFDRFDDELNGVTDAKFQRAGQEAMVVDVWGDQTMTCEFSDQTRLDFPWESAESTVSCSWRTEQGQSVAVRSEPLGGGNTLAKLERLGQEVEVLHAYDDGIFTARFDDRLEYNTPYEAFETRAPPDIMKFALNADKFLQHNRSTHQDPMDTAFDTGATDLNPSCLTACRCCSQRPVYYLLP